MELEQILARILQMQADAKSIQTVQAMALEYPHWADQITECWETHCELIRCLSGDSLPNPPEFDGYEVLGEVDRGGMGIVYRAKHKALNRIVALKVIRSGELADREQVARFRREAQIAAQLVHPGIVPIYEVGEGDRNVYYTMAFVDGISLRELGGSTALSIPGRVKLVHQLTQALEYAHRQGVAHRDIKPSNILVDAHGNPILIDFGLAHWAHGDSDLTQSGVTIGTPAYMAPEQIQIHRDHDFRRSDIYSLGAVLYFLLAGRPPFEAPTNFDVMLQLKDREPLRPSKIHGKVDRELDAICLRAMEKNPSDRYASAAEFGADLARWMSGEGIAQPRKSSLGNWIRWWKQEPGLVSHVVSITLVMVIVLLSHFLGYSKSDLHRQMVLLAVWLGVCFPLQRWIFRCADFLLPAVLWGLADVFFVSWLIANADAPRSLLLAAYPLMITVSALFYRTRFVLLMTFGCLVGFWSLAGSMDDPSLARTDFRLIFTSILLVQCLTLMSLIRKVRNLFTYRG